MFQIRAPFPKLVVLPPGGNLPPDWETLLFGFMDYQVKFTFGDAFFESIDIFLIRAPFPKLVNLPPGGNLPPVWETAM